MKSSLQFTVDELLIEKSLLRHPDQVDFCTESFNVENRTHGICLVEKKTYRPLPWAL